MVEPLDGRDQPEAALLEQVGDRHAGPDVGAQDRAHEPEVGPHELLLRRAARHLQGAQLLLGRVTAPRHARVVQGGRRQDAGLDRRGPGGQPSGRVRVAVGLGGFGG